MRNLFFLPTVLVLACAPTAREGAPRAAGPKTGTGEASTQGGYSQLVDAAWAAAKAGRAERAAELSERAVASGPEQPAAYVVWGHALAMQRQLDEAVQKYEKARQLGSDERVLFVELSSVYDVSGKYEDAIGVYRAWLARHPDDGEMHQELGLSLILRERYDEAAASLTEASKLLSSDLQVKEDLAYALLKAGQLQEAAAQVDAVLAKDGKRPGALFLAAQLAVARGEAKSALPLLDKALEVAPDDTRARALRARLLHLSGNSKAALDDYAWLLKHGAQDPSVLLGAAGPLIAEGRLDEAASIIDKAKAQAGTHLEVRFRLAQLAWHKGDKAALATLRALAKELPNHLELWRELRDAAKQSGDHKLVAKAQARVNELERGL